MALDAATLALCASEIKEKLLDAKIDKIFQPAKEEVLLLMRNYKQTFSLLVSARSGLARVCLTQEKYENPAVPPSFCMLLRKHLTGGRLTDVRFVPAERIIFLDFLCTNEMGDLVNNTLAAELMGRYCNIVLINRGLHTKPAAEEPAQKITDALKRISFDDSEIRQLLPGLRYTLPEPRQGLDFLRSPVKDITQQLAKHEGSALDALRVSVTGIGPVILREACFRAFGKKDAEINEETLHALEKAIMEIQQDFENKGKPQLVKNEEGMPFEFSFTALTQYVGAQAVEFESFSEMLEGYYAEKDRTERLRVKSRELRKAVHNMYERGLRKQAARSEEKQESENSEHLRIMGEVLTANLHAVNKSDRTVRLTNWYTGEEMSIELDDRLSPQENAQKYFKDYKKKQTAAKMLEELLAKGEKEIVYLESVLYEVDTAEGEAALEEIRTELKAQGFLKYYKPRNKKQKPEGFIHYVSADGFTIYVGRNNLQNEKLSIKTARGKDLWFHTKNAPGSHVVVMSEGQDIPLATQNQAAMLAVWHSSQKNSAKVAVDYTFVKNLRKTSDLPTGMVLYEHYETAYITPQQEEIEKIERLA